MINNISINLFYPLIAIIIILAMLGIYSLLDKIKFILPIFNKATDDLKQIAFTQAHERELHDLENRVKELENNNVL